jgi:putative nucleotidyltransferase with HDIG domain
LRIARTPEVSIRRYWWQAGIATFLVLVAPPVTVMWLENFGYINHPILSVGSGVAGSMLAASAGAALWMRAGSNDIAFSDLLLWGYLRRLMMEKRIMNSTKLLNHRFVSDDDSDIKNLQRIAAALEATDSYTHGHSRRVARISCMIAREMGLPKKDIDLLRIAAAVHDVGKLYVPSHIINKPGTLTSEEFELVKQHSAKGAELVARMGNRDLTAIVRHHHERMDGRGYPDGVAGLSIPLGARIIAVADTFDAMTSYRSYRNPANHKAALETLRRAAGAQLDPEAVRAFLTYYSGKRGLARWALVASAPHRLVSELAGWLQGAAAAGVKGGPAVASSALLTGAVLTGTVVAPAVTKHLPKLERLTGAGAVAETGESARTTDRTAGLPAGLARKEHLPPGLAKKDQLPPGLQKKVAGEKKNRPPGKLKKAEPPGLAKERTEPPGLAKKARAHPNRKDDDHGGMPRKPTRQRSLPVGASRPRTTPPRPRRPSPREPRRPERNRGARRNH